MKIRILFTKKIENKYLKKYLDDNKFEIICIPVIKIEFNDIDFEIKDHKNFIFTSENAVKWIENKKFPHNSNFFVVGEKSKKALEKLGYPVKIVSKNAFELFKEIKNNIKPCKLLHFCSSKALPTLCENFSKTNFKYEKIEAYKTKHIYPIYNDKVDALVFFSPSGVESFLKNNKISNEKLFAIGETTAKKIKEFTNKEVIFSKNETTNDILKTIKESYK